MRPDVRKDVVSVHAWLAQGKAGWVEHVGAVLGLALGTTGNRSNSPFLFGSLGLYEALLIPLLVPLLFHFLLLQFVLWFILFRLCFNNAIVSYFKICFLQETVGPHLLPYFLSGPGLCSPILLTVVGGTLLGLG